MRDQISSPAVESVRVIGKQGSRSAKSAIDFGAEIKCSAPFGKMPMLEPVPQGLVKL